MWERSLGSELHGCPWRMLAEDPLSLDVFSYYGSREGAMMALLGDPAELPHAFVTALKEADRAYRIIESVELERRRKQAEAKAKNQPPKVSGGWPR